MLICTFSFLPAHLENDDNLCFYIDFIHHEAAGLKVNLDIANNLICSYYSPHSLKRFSLMT